MEEANAVSRSPSYVNHVATDKSEPDRESLRVRVRPLTVPPSFSSSQPLNYYVSVI